MSEGRDLNRGSCYRVMHHMLYRIYHGDGLALSLMEFSFLAEYDILNLILLKLACDGDVDTMWHGPTLPKSEYFLHPSLHHIHFHLFVGCIDLSSSVRHSLLLRSGISVPHLHLAHLLHLPPPREPFVSLQLLGLLS